MDITRKVDAKRIARCPMLAQKEVRAARSRSGPLEIIPMPSAMLSAARAWPRTRTTQCIPTRPGLPLDRHRNMKYPFRHVCELIHQDLGSKVFTACFVTEKGIVDAYVEMSTKGMTPRGRT